MVYPAIIEAGSAGGYGIIFGSAGYACILCVINYSYFDFYAGCHVDQQTSKKKVSPKVLSSLLIPIITMILSIPVVLIVTGPVATWIGNGLCGVVSFIFTKDVGCRRAAYRRGCAVSCFDRRS